MSTGAKLQSWVTRQWQKNGLWAHIMRPLSCLYGLISQRRRQAYACGKAHVYRPPVPVLVIGNIYAGGTGKTPLACAVGQTLERLGWHPGLVSRGYGRASKELAVDQGSNLDWLEFGDEPALIAHKTGMPVSVHRDRGLAAQALIERFPQTDIIISDDGLQHYGLARDFEILVQDERGVGNGLLLPAGPLREPVSRLDEVDLVLTRKADLKRGTKPAFSVAITGFWSPATDERCSVEQFIERIKSEQPIAAAAGIGVPERFFQSLRQLGVELSECHPLADHAAIDSNWLRSLAVKTILITEKDAVKLDPSVNARIWVCETSVSWSHQDFDAFLTNALAQAGIKHSES